MSDLRHIVQMGEKLEQQQVQIDFMSVTQERQRSRIQNLAMTQRDLLDQMAVLEAKLEIAEGMLLDEGGSIHSVYEERVDSL